MSVAFDLQPTLVGELVELRPLREDDYPELFAAGADPLIWEQHPVPDRHARPAFDAFFATHLASGGALVVIDGNDRSVIIASCC
jgi:RimJ/RimL family protein N-acetyltransferase